MQTSIETPNLPTPDRLPPVDRSFPRHKAEESAPLVYLGAGITGGEVLVRKAGLRACAVDSPRALLEAPSLPVARCVIFDASRFRPEDLLLHGKLTAQRPEIPTICTADDIDVPIVVRLMKAGCFDVLRKPVAEDVLVGTIRLALQRSAAQMAKTAELRRLEIRYDSLSLRERQVFKLLATGLINKQVGAELGISEITVKAHRGRVMSKMQAASFAGLIQMAMVLLL